MTISRNDLNEKLYGMLYSNGFDPTPLSADGAGSGDDSIIPEEAEAFQVVANGSPVTITITPDRALKMYFNKKATRGEGWYSPEGLLHRLIDFRREHNLRDFEPEEQPDGKKLKFDMAKRANMKQEELSLNEGYHPMGKRASYNDGIPTVKIVIQHNRQLGEGEQRFRSVEKIFIENADGERFRSPTNSPGLSKIFGRLIAEGDKPHGEHWNHLVSLVEDYTKLRGFVRATKNGVFNESAKQWIEAGVNRYTELRETLQSLTTIRGYRSYFESWTPTLVESNDEGSVDLTEMFKSSVLDSRVEAALPVIKRLGVVSESNLTQSLEEWAGRVERDAVYGVEDSAEGKLDEGCDCGPDCDCPDCQEHNSKVKKKLSVRESRINLEQIEQEFGKIEYTGGVFSKNQPLFKYLVEHYGSDNDRAAVAFMCIVNQKIEQDHALPLSEEISQDDPILNDIFDYFENASNTRNHKPGDKVIALELSAMPFGKPKEVWIQGSYKPLTIEQITPEYVFFTNGEQKPHRRVTQLRLWNQVGLFDSVKAAQSIVSWLVLKAGDRDDWNLKIYVDEPTPSGLEEAKSPEEFMAFVGKPNPSLLANERADIHLSPYQWELYTSSPEIRKQVLTAAQALNDTFNRLVNEPNATRESVRNGMFKVMDKHSKYGAYDTEPRTVLHHLLDKYFPEDDAMAEAELSPKQKKLDKNKNSRLDAEDFKMLRGEKTDEGYDKPEPYGRGIRRGDFVKSKSGGSTVYRVFAMDGSTYVVKPYEGNNNYGEEVEFDESELTRVKDPVGTQTNVEEGNLTPGQKKAGQVSATEKTKSTGPILGKGEKKHPFQGRLVGTSESADDPLAAIRRLSGIKK